jgi:hypothetical protein
LQSFRPSRPGFRFLPRGRHLQKPRVLKVY